MTGAVGPFEFATAARIVIGAGRVAELPALAAQAGTRALVCTGSRPGRHGRLVESLGMATASFPVGGEPTVEMAVAATRTAREHAADVVVAIGGGSVIDLGKAVAMLLANGGEPLDYLEVVGRGLPVTRPSVPLLAVPTTAGSGAEVTANAVLASPEHGRKASLRSAHLLPRLALVDPELTLDCPPAVTASSGLDALTQCLEPFVSVRANPLTDALAREGLRRAGAGLRAAYRDGSDLAARTDMALCSLLGGLALANAKLGAVHGFAGVIGGLVDAPHGAVCAALLEPVVAMNVRALRAREPASAALLRYEEAARLLTGRADATVEDALGWLRDTIAELAVPGLASFGLGEGQATEVVAKTATASSTAGNPVVLTDDELYEVLTQAR